MLFYCKLLFALDSKTVRVQLLRRSVESARCLMEKSATSSFLRFRVLRRRKTAVLQSIFGLSFS